MADFLIGLAFVVMIVVPAIVASLHWSKTNDGDL
jgi:Na+(H+)/acetate symporter ActP